MLRVAPEAAVRGDVPVPARVLAAMTGVAIANARLLAEAEERERVVTAAHGVATALLAGADLDDGLHLTALHARCLAGADLALVALVAGEGLVVRAADGDGVEEIIGTVFSLVGSVPGLVFGSGTTDIGGDFARDAAVGTPLAMFASAPSATVPLWSDGHPFGILTVARRKGRPAFGRGEVQLLQAFAAQASVILDYGRANLERQQFAVIEDEQRIASQLNGTVIQHLFRAGLTLHTVRQSVSSPVTIERLNSVIDELDDGITALRLSVFGETTSMLHGLVSRPGR